MLSSVMDELIHNIQIRIPLDSLTEALLSDMRKFVQKGKGNTDFEVMVYDQNENVSVEMFSRYKKIALSDELIHYLSENHELEFKLY